MLKVTKEAWLWILSTLVLMGAFELAHDEAYYWALSRLPDWGYFDHPPLTMWLIKVFSWMGGEWSVRLGPSLFLWIGLLTYSRSIVSENLKSSFWLLIMNASVILFTASLALPDTTLLGAIAFYFYFLKKYLERKSIGDVLGLALSIALMLYAKYHGVLIVFFTLLAIPQEVGKRNFWLVLVASLVLYSPHLFWQYKNEFVTFRYHFFERPKGTISVSSVLSLLMVQISFLGILIGPWFWWNVVFKRKFLTFKNQSQFQKVLMVNFLGLPLFFLLSLASKKFEANWLIMLPLITSMWLIEKSIDIPSRVLWGGAWVSILTKLILISMIFVPFFPIKRLQEFRGWKNWSQQIADLNCPIVANTYQVASKLSFYMPHQPWVWSMNIRSRKNQFDLWKLPYAQDDQFCFLTNKTASYGESYSTPDGKKLTLMPRQSIQSIIKLKEL